MNSRPDTHILASFLTLHCDVLLFDIISSLFLTSHITTCDIRSLSFLSSLLTRHYPCFTLSGGFSRVTAWRIVTFFLPVHPMGNGSEISVWEVVLLVRIHVTSVHGESLFIWLRISCEIIHYWSEYVWKKNSALLGSFCKSIGWVQIYDMWSTKFHGTKLDLKSCKWSIEFVVSLFGYIFYFPLLFGFISVNIYMCIFTCYVHNWILSKSEISFKWGEEFNKHILIK